MFGKKKSEVEFRGVSASRDKKNATILFVIEAVVVLLFIAGVLFILNYLRIFPLDTISEKLFGGLPARNVYDISVVSQVPGYEVKLNNEEGLINELVSMGVLGKKHSWQSWGSTGNENLQNINITLVPDEINQNTTLDAEGNVIIGAIPQLSGSTLDIDVYLSKITLDNVERTSTDKGNSLLWGAYTPIYRGMYPSTVENPNLSAPALIDSAQRLTKGNYLTITK